MNTNLMTYLISDLAVNPCDTLDKYLPSTVLTVYIWQRCRPVAPVPLYMRLLTSCCMQGANMELWGKKPPKLLAQATAQPLPPNAYLHLLSTEIQPSLPPLWFNELTVIPILYILILHYSI